MIRTPSTSGRCPSSCTLRDSPRRPPQASETAGLLLGVRPSSVVWPAAFQSALPPAVLLPESFRGGCSFGSAHRFISGRDLILRACIRQLLLALALYRSQPLSDYRSCSSPSEPVCSQRPGSIARAIFGRSRPGQAESGGNRERAPSAYVDVAAARARMSEVKPAQPVRSSPQSRVPTLALIATLRIAAASVAA